MTIKLHNKIASAAAVATLVLSSLAPIASAADSTIIGGNGSGSTTSVRVSEIHENTTVQDNTASIRNQINSNSSSGGNVASGNTGGDVLIGTGNSNQRVTISNSANINQAQTSDTGSTGGTSGSSVLGNGSNSSNFFTNTTEHTNSISQTNNANFDNSVNLRSQTGGNYASDNTGRFGGNSPVTIVTGNSTSDVAIMNQANANRASLGSGIGGLGFGSLGGGFSGNEISGNGSGSINSTQISTEHRNSVVQNNNADISNHLTQWASSGRNVASDNTGGDTFIGSGSSYSSNWIDNRANINMAQMNPGMMGMGGSGNGALGNGSRSSTFYTEESSHQNQLYQTGNATLDNVLRDYSSSGGNYASDNTSGWNSFGTTRVLSGSSMSDNYVSNQSNINSSGSGFNMPGGWALSLGWDLGSLMGL